MACDDYVVKHVSQYVPISFLQVVWGANVAQREMRLDGVGLGLGKRWRMGVGVGGGGGGGGDITIFLFSLSSRINEIGSAGVKVQEL